MRFRRCPPELRLEGHAGYAPVGQDIVCAAVSALCAALCAAAGLEEPGENPLCIRGASAQAPIFAMAAAGLEGLARQFPKNVSFEEVSNSEKRI